MELGRLHREFSAARHRVGSIEPHIDVAPRASMRDPNFCTLRASMRDPKFQVGRGGGLPGRGAGLPGGRAGALSLGGGRELLTCVEGETPPATCIRACDRLPQFADGEGKLPLDTGHETSRTRAERRLAQIIGLDCTVPSTAWNRFSSGAFWAGFVRYISRLGAPGSRCSALPAATCR